LSERDAALDFIYKGFRDGRRQKAAKRFQRGNERLGDRLAPIMGGRVLSRPEVASAPPSTDSSASPDQFGDNIITPDDESTPFDESRALPEPKGVPMLPAPGESSHASNQPVEETVSSPPDPLNDKIHSDMMPTEGFGQGPPPPPAELKTNVEPEVEPEKTGLSREEYNTMINNQYDEKIAQVKELMRSGEMPFREGTQKLGLLQDSRQNHLDTFGDVNTRKLPDINELPGRPPKKVEIPPETGEDVQNPQDIDLPPDHPALNPRPADSKSAMSKVMEAANKKPEGVPSEEPVELISRDEEPKEPDMAFEEAYSGMVNDGKEVAQGVNRGINESFNEFNRIGRELGKEPEAQPTPEPKPDSSVKDLVSEHVKDRKNKILSRLEERAENRAKDESLSEDDRSMAELRRQMMAAMKEGKSEEEIQELVQGSNLVGGDLNINGEKVQLDEDGNYTSPDGSISITNNNPKPDPSVAEVAPKAIKPSKKELADNLKVEDLPGDSTVKPRRESDTNVPYADFSRHIQAGMSGNENSLEWIKDNPDAVDKYAGKEGLPQRILDYLGIGKKTPKKKKATKRTPTKAEKKAEPKLKDLPGRKSKKITPPKRKATTSGKKKLEAAAEKLNDDAEAAMSGKAPKKNE